ncbi:MAG: hypothetical protein AAGA30_21230 [Planctomycetota bacterium]
MQFGFYPGHQSGCGYPRECPHLGGASVGHLVHIVNTSEDSRLDVHRQLDAERERNAKLVVEVESLEKALEQAKLELRLERQSKFSARKQNAEPDDGHCENAFENANDTKGKLGAPIGHVGWYRKTPSHYDLLIDVPAPARCPHCKADKVSVYDSQEASENLEEDIIDSQHHVTLFIHPAARCRECRRWVQQVGIGEILGSRIGPNVRTMAIYLRNEIGVSYRKVSRAIEDLLGLNFTPAAVIGFEKRLAEQAQPVVVDIEKKSPAPKVPSMLMKRGGRSMEIEPTAGFTRPATTFTSSLKLLAVRRFHKIFWADRSPSQHPLLIYPTRFAQFSGLFSVSQLPNFSKTF